MGQNQRNGFTPVGNYQKIRLPNSRLKLRWPRPETHGKIDIDKLEENFAQILEQLDENHSYLNRTDWGNVAGSRWATLVIAAADSTAASRASADYVCSGSGDDLVVQRAVNTLLARTEPGRIVFLEGTYTFTSSVTIALAAGKMLMFQGVAGRTEDLACKVTINSSSPAFDLSGVIGTSTTFGFHDLAVVNIGSGSAITTNNTRIEAHGSYFASTSGAALALDGGLSGTGAGSRIVNCRISASTRGITLSHELDTVIVGNTISVSSSTGTGIRLNSDAAYVVRGVITNNRLSGAGSSSWGIACNNGSSDGTFVEDTIIANNQIRNFGSGIMLNGSKNCAILSNLIGSCVIGIETGNVGIIGNQRVYVAGNHVYDSTGAAHIKVVSSTIGTSDIAILFNKCRGTTPTNAIVINSSGCADCAVAFNDTWSGYASAAVSDNGTNTRRESDIIGSTLNTNARVGIRKNTGASTFLRRRLNIIEGTAILATVADDSVDEEVDITLGINPATDLDNNARVGVRKNSAGLTFTRRRVNLIEGSNIVITTADDSGSEEVDITIAASTGLGTTTIKNNGSTVGAESTLNFIPGAGVTFTMTNPAGEIDITIAAGGTAAAAAAEFNHLMHS